MMNSLSQKDSLTTCYYEHGEFVTDQENLVSPEPMTEEQRRQKRQRSALIYGASACCGIVLLIVVVVGIALLATFLGQGKRFFIILVCDGLYYGIENVLPMIRGLFS